MNQKSDDHKTWSKKKQSDYLQRNRIFNALSLKITKKIKDWEPDDWAAALALLVVAVEQTSPKIEQKILHTLEEIPYEP